MAAKNHQSETNVVSLVKNKMLKLDDSFRDSETKMFIKYCQNDTLKRFQGKG